MTHRLRRAEARRCKLRACATGGAEREKTEEATLRQGRPANIEVFSGQAVAMGAIWGFLENFIEA